MKPTAQLTANEIERAYIGQDFIYKDQPVIITGYNSEAKKIQVKNDKGELIEIDLFIVHGLMQLI